MSVKRMKVYICDFCGKKAPEETRYGFCGYEIAKVKSAPDGWVRKAKMDLCFTCATNFARVMEGEKDDG